MIEDTMTTPFNENPPPPTDEQRKQIIREWKAEKERARIARVRARERAEIEATPVINYLDLIA